jgi:agmatine deiminase
MSAKPKYRMPAEWDRHEATWIAWPHNEDDWPGRFEPIPWVYGEIVRKLSAVERVRILVQDADVEESARVVLTKVGANLAAVEFFRQPTDRVWTRDFGPSFVKDEAGAVTAVKWRFNGWAKYENHLWDEAAGRAIAGFAGVPMVTPDFVLEGGSIEVNGPDWLMTTEECLLSPIQQRNPGVDKRGVEEMLREHLGIRRFIWLKNGIAGDDTHGHIDDLARFTSADEAVIVTEADPSDPNYEPLRENLAILKATGARVRELPLPAPLWFDGVRLPASYANFYIANGLVLVPTFNDPHDWVALATIAEGFPDREVVGINCVELVWGLGTLHCMTQQQPEGLATAH